MDLAIRIALLFCLVFFVGAVGTASDESSDTVCDVTITESQLCCHSAMVTLMLEDQSIMCDSKGAVKLNGSDSGGINVTCGNSTIEQFIRDMREQFIMNCTENMDCSAVNFTCNTTEIMTIMEADNETDDMLTSTTLMQSQTGSPKNDTMTITSTTPVVSTSTTEVTNSTSLSMIKTESKTTESYYTLTTSMSHLQTDDDSTVGSSDPMPMTFSLTDILWIVLGCLIALIIITLGAIILVSVAHCRRYKSKHLYAY